MPYSPEIQKRVDTLTQDLSKEIARGLRNARWNNGTAFALKIGIVVSSIVAALGGLANFLNMPKSTVGAIALLPGLMALAASNLKFQERANWHCRKVDSLMSLRRRLLFEIPESPSVDNLASISSDWSEVDESAQTEWERSITSGDDKDSRKILKTKK
jgi:hypothetical protein